MVQKNLSLIVAMANHRVIGINNTLPWKLSADLKHFKAITLGKPVIMGRKTWESIGRPLPERENIVISSNKQYVADGAVVFSSIDEALAHTQNAEEVMLMGGANLYAQLLPIVNKMYLTLIDLDIKGDAFFPEWSGREWAVVEQETHHQEALDSQPAFEYQFITLSRKPAINTQP